MKSFVSMILAVMVLVAAGASCMAGGGQQQEQIMLPPDMGPTDELTAQVAKLFVEQVFKDYSERGEYDEMFQDFEDESRMNLDPDNMYFELTYRTPPQKEPDADTLDLRIVVSRPDRAPEPGDRSLVRDFPGLGLRAVIQAKTTGFLPPEELYYRLEWKLWTLQSRDPQFADPIIDVAAPMMQDIYDGIAALEDQYPQLAGFSSKALLRLDRDNLSFGVFFENKIGDSTRSNPAGELLEEDSCVISLSLGQYIDLQNRYTRGGPAWHFYEIYKNMNLELNWTADANDEELVNKLYEIVEPHVPALRELEKEYAGDAAVEIERGPAVIEPF